MMPYCLIGLAVCCLLALLIWAVFAGGVMLSEDRDDGNDY